MRKVKGSNEKECYNFNFKPKDKIISTPQKDSKTNSSQNNNTLQGLLIN